MNPSQQHVPITVKILELGEKEAYVLSDLHPRALIEAILYRFRSDCPYLGDDPSRFELRRNDNVALEQEAGKYFRENDQLVLVEKQDDIPASLRPDMVMERLYLCEWNQEGPTGKVYRLYCLPAIIGRPMPSAPDEIRLAVNLQAHPSGAAVSRRHARITRNNDHYYLTNISADQGNPVVILRPSPPQVEEQVDVNEEVQELHNDDMIVLSSSGIQLKFFVRPL